MSQLERWFSAERDAEPRGSAFPGNRSELHDGSWDLQHRSVYSDRAKSGHRIALLETLASRDSDRSPLAHQSRPTRDTTQCHRANSSRLGASCSSNFSPKRTNAKSFRSVAHAPTAEFPTQGGSF